MKVPSLLPLSLALMLVAGCASTTQFVPLPDQGKKIEDPAKARIYVMRPTPFGSALAMSVSDTGKPIGKTGPVSYICWERPPGDATVSAMSEGVSNLPLTVEAGNVYFVFQHIRVGMLIARTELELVSEEEGLRVLKKCKPPKVDPAKAPPSAIAR